MLNTKLQQDIVWYTNNISVISKGVEKVNEELIQKVFNKVDPTTEPKTTLTDQDNKIFTELEIDECNINLPRTRQFMDRFHVFDNAPKSRDSKVKNALSIMRRLIIQATIQFDADDFDSVVKHLSEKKEFDSMDQLLDHFYFNREWWYRRVRVYPPTHFKGMSNIDAVKEFLEKANGLKEVLLPVLPNLDSYLEGIKTMFCEGKLSETFDVQNYQADGQDIHGLSLWLRRRGSNRSENLHQKMKIAFGTRSYGAEVGHFLLLLVSYRYNLTTGYRRDGKYNFGMSRLDIIDRIQIWNEQIFNVNIFPSHENSFQFKPIEDFIAVGIGPLNYKKEFLHLSKKPHQSLKGDLQFVAVRMLVEGPPLSIHLKEEKKLFST